MKKSLLGHLYSHIRGSAEDVATMSLQYLLTYYDPLRKSFNELLADRLGVTFDANTAYECQSVGDEQERPDMSGTDTEGNEVILCEAKFYAGLTSNQPLTYLERLRKEGGKGLVFICPKDRVVSLWDTLKAKCKDNTIVTISDICISVDTVNMAIVSWEEIITNLTRTADAVEKSALADIEQLSGYCEQIVSSAFIPFKEEELGAIVAKKYEQLMYVLDRVLDTILSDKTVQADVNGLRPTPHRHGYRRYFRLNGLSVDLCLDLELWANDKCVDTPIWVRFKDDRWTTPNHFIDCVSSIPTARKCKVKGDIYLAIDVPCGVVEDDVVDGIKKQVYDYLRFFETIIDLSGKQSNIVI